MNSNGNSAARLRRLEALWQAAKRCPACGNWPTRIVGVDPDTGEETSENMPPSGCPTCGREPRNTLELVGIDVNML